MVVNRWLTRAALDLAGDDEGTSPTLFAHRAGQNLWPASRVGFAIGHNGGVRRPLASLLFAIAFVLAGIALGGWLLERTALSPHRVAVSPGTVLADAPLRKELVHLITDATAKAMYPNDANSQVRVLATVEQVVSIPAGAPLFAKVLEDAHAHLIGQTKAPVVVSPEQLVEIVRDQHAAAVPPLQLTVPRVSAFAGLRSALDTLVPICAIASAVFFLVALLSRPERDVLCASLGVGLLAMAVVIVLFAFVIPAYVPPLFDKSVWTHIPTGLAKGRVVFTIITAALFAIVGGVLYSASTRMRRSRRWSTPVSTYRYREERRWS